MSLEKAAMSFVYGVTLACMRFVQGPNRNCQKNCVTFMSSQIIGVILSLYLHSFETERL